MQGWSSDQLSGGSISVALVQYEGLRHRALQVVAGRDLRPRRLSGNLSGSVGWASPAGLLIQVVVCYRTGRCEASSATKVGELPPSSPLLSSPSLVTAAACETLSDCDQVGWTVSEHSWVTDTGWLKRVMVLTL